MTNDQGVLVAGLIPLLLLCLVLVFVISTLIGVGYTVYSISSDSFEQSSRCGYSMATTPERLERAWPRAEFGIDLEWDSKSPPRDDRWKLSQAERVLLERTAYRWSQHLMSRLGDPSLYSDLEMIERLFQRFALTMFLGGTWEFRHGLRLLQLLRASDISPFRQLDACALLDWLLFELKRFRKQAGEFRAAGQPLPATRIDLSEWLSVRRLMS